MDPTYSDVSMDDFPKQIWKEYCGEEKEEIPHDRPRPLGKEFVIRIYVDADFAGD